MNKDTGAIARFESLRDALDANHKIPLTEAQAAQLLPLARPERISFAAQMTTEERNKRKAARRAQRDARKANRR